LLHWRRSFHCVTLPPSPTRFGPPRRKRLGGDCMPFINQTMSQWGTCNAKTENSQEKAGNWLPQATVSAEGTRRIDFLVARFASAPRTKSCTLSRTDTHVGCSQLAKFTAISQHTAFCVRPSFHDCAFHVHHKTLRQIESVGRSHTCKNNQVWNSVILLLV
jgi:hypothetical protein